MVVCTAFFKARLKAILLSRVEGQHFQQLAKQLNQASLSLGFRVEHLCQQPDCGFP